MSKMIFSFNSEVTLVKVRNLCMNFHKYYFN